MNGEKVEFSLENGIMALKHGKSLSKALHLFEDCHLHVAWRSTKVVRGEGKTLTQASVFMQGRYENLFLYYYINKNYKTGQCCLSCTRKLPLFNVITILGCGHSVGNIYNSPSFDKKLQRLISRYFSLINNRILIKNNTQILGTKEFIDYPKIVFKSNVWLFISEHSDLVSCRNILIS